MLEKYNFFLDVKSSRICRRHYGVKFNINYVLRKKDVLLPVLNIIHREIYFLEFKFEV
jgi:hypothetical protein